jgi:hypothetical protein
VIARRLGTVLTLIVLVAAGAYLIVYLYRWEWNRALVAGVIFVAAEIAIVATSLLRRLRSLEARIDEQLRAVPQPIDRIRDAAPAPKKPFEWLDPTRTNVFVPVLLGAGVILALVGHAVERLASATATPVREHDLVSRLSAIALPAGGLLAPGGHDGLAPMDVPDTTSRWRSMAPKVFVAIVCSFLLAATIEVIADETQDREDAPILDGTARVELVVHNRFTQRSPIRTAEALYVACRHTIGTNVEATEFTRSGDAAVSFVIRPDIGEHAQRRFVGCLEDALFDRISASVASIDHRP